MANLVFPPGKQTRLSPAGVRQIALYLQRWSANELATVVGLSQPVGAFSRQVAGATACHVPSCHALFSLAKYPQQWTNLTEGNPSRRWLLFSAFGCRGDQPRGFTCFTDHQRFVTKPSLLQPSFPACRIRNIETTPQAATAPCRDAYLAFLILQKDPRVVPDNQERTIEF